MYSKHQQPSGDPDPPWHPLPGQVKNRAGGHSYGVTDEVRLQRFLIMGCEGGTYYTTKTELKRENVQCIDRLIMANKGEEAVKCIIDVSSNDRSCKQSTTIYALAICARSNDLKTKNAAYRAIVDVCRIPTHLFEFVKYCENISTGTGWGRAQRVAISKWYNKQSYKEDPQKLANHVTKYKSRHSWSHVDVLRLAHVRPETPAISRVIQYLVKGLSVARSESLPMDDDESKEIQQVIDFLEAVEEGKKCKKSEIEKMKTLIETFKLAREHVPTTMLDRVEIWEMLFIQMPTTAMIRNLGKMSSLGMFGPGSDSYYENLVVKKLTDPGLLKGAKIHPFTLFVAWNQYKAGQGERGKLNWPVNSKIVAALENGFYLAFRNADSTGKRFLLAVDVSDTMTAEVAGTKNISCREAAAAMMLLTLKTERNCDVMAFSEQFTQLAITENDTLKTAIDKCSKLPSNRTDCSLPMKFAVENRKLYDVFVVYTDSETFFGNIHPARALMEYRKYSHIHDARLIVCGMAANGFSIADPSDPYMLDIVGFDTEAPKAMTAFINAWDG